MAEPLVVGRGEWGEEISVSSPFRSQWVIGVPGSGKSTFLGQVAVWYALHGCGVVVLDIKDGKLATDVVTQSEIPLEQMIYFSPGQSYENRRIWTLNPLDGNKANVLDNLMDMLSRVGQMQAAFTKINKYLSMSIRLAQHQPHVCTLHDVVAILTNQDVRKVYLDAELPDRVRESWEQFNRLSKMNGEVSKAQFDEVESTVNRLDDWIIDEPLASLIKGRRSTLRLSEELDAGRLIVCDLVRGMPPGQVIEAGNLVMSQLLNAALERDPLSDKRPWVVVADEFDLLAGDFFRHSLDKLRAAGLRIVAAHQNLSQLSDGLQSSLASVPIKIFFKPSPPDVAKLRTLFPGTKDLWKSLAKHQAAVSEDDAESDRIPWLPAEEGSDWRIANTEDWPRKADMQRLTDLSQMMLHEPFTQPLDLATKDEHAPTQTTPPIQSGDRETVSPRPNPPRRRSTRVPRQGGLWDTMAISPTLFSGGDDD